MPSEEVLAQLKTTADGLTKEEVTVRREQFGLNELPRSRRLPRLRILLEQFQSPIIVILLLAGLVTILINDLKSSIFIFLAVLVNVALGFYQEDKAETALAGLQKFL